MSARTSAVTGTWSEPAGMISATVEMVTPLASSGSAFPFILGVRYGLSSSTKLEFYGKHEPISETRRERSVGVWNSLQETHVEPSVDYPPARAERSPRPAGYATNPLRL